MDLEIVPAICKATKDENGVDVAPLFSGSVTIKMMSMPESYKFKSKYGRKTMAMSGVVEEGSEKAFATMDLLGELGTEIQPFFANVALKDLSNGKEIKSADDLYYYEPMFSVISEIAMKFIQGFSTKE